MIEDKASDAASPVRAGQPPGGGGGGGGGLGRNDGGNLGGNSSGLSGAGGGGRSGIGSDVGGRSDGAGLGGSGGTDGGNLGGNSSGLSGPGGGGRSGIGGGVRGGSDGGDSGRTDGGNPGGGIGGSGDGPGGTCRSGSSGADLGPGPSGPASDPGGGISARDVTVTYRNGHTALRSASFAIPRGTVTALVGVNGSGKSTLFKAIMGFVPVARGEISLLGMSVPQALRRNLVAYVPQAEEVDWSFPVLVEDVVMMGRYGHMGFLRRPRAADHAAVDRALARVGMQPFRHRQIGELSGGQKKRVFLARALAQDGQVILLDEPFTGVDVTTEDQIIALLRELRDEGRVMLVATHNLGSVPEFCDRVVLVKGTVLAHGPTETTFTRENLQTAFGGVLRRFTLGGDTLHDDDDPRHITILTDDERPLVQYGERTHTKDGTLPDPLQDEAAP